MREERCAAFYVQLVRNHLRASNRMNSDVLQVLSSRLDDNTLIALSSSPELGEEIVRSVHDQYWWYLRAQHLFNADLRMRPGAQWSVAYPSLEQAQKSIDNQDPQGPFMKTIDNVLATSVLMELGYDPSVNNSQALVEAARDGDIDVVRLLLSDRRVDPSASDNIAISRLILENDIPLAKRLLLDPRVNPGEHYSAVLRTACRYGRVEIVKQLLLDPRVDPNVDYMDQTPVYLAATYGHVEALKVLLEDGRADPAESDNAPLIVACKNGFYDIVELLLADPRVDPTRHDNYALRRALERGHDNIAQLLLRDPRVAALEQQTTSEDE